VRSALPSTFEWAARIGYATRAIVFLLVGFLSILAAFGSGAAAPGPADAFRSLLSQPFGLIALLLIALGLLCFAAWRLLQALLNADHCGTDLKGWARRAIYLATALFYIGLAAVPVGMVLGWIRGTGGDKPVRDWTSWLLAVPAGRWLVAAIGVGIIATGSGIAVSGVRAKFASRLKLKQEPRRVVTTLGSFGFIARAVVFVLIGAFLVFAAVDADPREARGLTGAFRAIQQQPFGAVLLATTAAGFIAFGCYEIAEAASRRITVPGWPRRRRKPA
jgi:hypothetical protein